MTGESHKIAPDGYGIIIGSVIIGILSFAFVHPVLGAAFLIWAVFCVYFFRNPARLSPQEPHLLVSPADGKIMYIGRATETNLLKREMQRITVFMSPFNVHVNRVPETGTVAGVQYSKGNFLAAFNERASTENERSAIHLRTEDGLDIVFVQIAGWFARRIVSYPKVGDTLKRGSIFGLIKFSSRMDVFFPDGFVPAVKVGDVVQAGQTVLARKG